MLCEIPIVVSDSAENDKWVDDKLYWFLFSTKSSDKLAEILIKLIRNKSLRANVGKEVRKIIIKKYDHDNKIKKVNDLYLKLL